MARNTEGKPLTSCGSEIFELLVTSSSSPDSFAPSSPLPSSTSPSPSYPSSPLSYSSSPLPQCRSVFQAVIVLHVVMVSSFRFEEYIFLIVIIDRRREVP